MTDIIDRLRGREPLELGDRLAAATEIDRLLVALVVYGEHLPACGKHDYGSGHPGECNCGLDAAIHQNREGE